MPVQVSVPLRDFSLAIDRHLTILDGVGSLPPRTQKLVAELLLVRAFDEFQTAIAGMAWRLSCGAQYLDGSRALLLNGPYQSEGAAMTAFRRVGRSSDRQCRWTQARLISDSVGFVIDPADHFHSAIHNSTTPILEIASVRNRVAHRTSKSARNYYRQVIALRYGAPLNRIDPGTLLLSSRFSPSLIEEYLRQLRTITKSVAR